MAKILLLNGPNLNLLGTREPDIYGSTTLEDVVTQLDTMATNAGHTLIHVQSNAEHELINCIHTKQTQGIDYCIINPAAFTHTSVALRDAFSGVGLPFIEVHISNVHARESFRHVSYLSDIADAVICGCGTQGYELALQHAMSKF